MNRLLLPRIAILLAFTALIGRLYQLQLVDTEASRFRYATEQRTTQYLPIRPLRGEVFASDGRTLLAESVPIFTVSIRPAELDKALPRGTPERDEMFARLSQLLGITSTLTISPAVALEQNAALRSDLAQGIGEATLAHALSAGGDAQLQASLAPDQAASGAALDVPPGRSLTALKIAQAYSDTVRLANPLLEKVEQADIPSYQTLILQQDIPREIALVLRENSVSLPGVVVEQDYRRRYPLSPELPTLSHLLGYVGRINQCELVGENAARSWSTGLLESIGNAARCRIVAKEINPYQLGMPRYLNDDRIGKDGVEASYEEQIRGQLGTEAVVVDVLGRPVRAPRTIQEAENGANLILTIDVPLQRQVEQILRNWIAEGERLRLSASGKDAWKKENYAPITSGAAIVLEVKTGRILAMASWPAYDNNVWVNPEQLDALQDLLAPSDPQQQAELARLTPLLNRAIAGQYPPGSTLKQFDAAIALQEQVITPETKVPDPGRLVIEDEFVAGRTYVFPNSGAVPRGEKNVSDALKVSSNVFFFSVAGGNQDRVVNLKPEEQNIPRGLGIDRLADGLGWFGLGQPSQVRLAGEAAGRVPTPAWKERALREAWTTGDTYNMAIGQGNLEVTPLQLVNAAAAIANNGTLYRPQIVKAVVDPSGEQVDEVEPEVLRTIPVDPSYLAVVREGMRLSVTEGVNRAARDDCSGLAIAGKTGTAEFGPPIVLPDPDPNKPPRIERQTHSWFVGFAPYDDPQIQVLVLSEGTGSLGDGSATIAVPAVTQIMQAYFGVTPPDPLPRGCQQGLPPLPPRVDPATTQSTLDQHERQGP